LSSVPPIPPGFAGISAYLVLDDAHKAIDFYKKAFGASTGCVMSTPDGAVMHGEVKMFGSTVMLTTANPQWGMKSVQQYGGSPVSLMIYCNDCDAAYKKAVDAGATTVAPPMDAFWGDRYCKLKDPFGIEWAIATHKEDLNQAQLEERQKQWMATMADKCGGA
jgi:PhnB protein